MVQFEHGPIMWPALAEANVAIQFTGEKKNFNKTTKLF
jgi:hypothetical protein